MFNYPYIIELLSPKKDTDKSVESLLDRFAERYELSLSLGCGVSVPDNPMGQKRFNLLECVEKRGLIVDPERIIMNLNTFHTKNQLDEILGKSIKLGIKKLLIIRGDGGPDLPKLDPGSIGGQHNIATTQDLLRYINTDYKGQFLTGVAFNPYKNMSFETMHIQSKVEAGAKFIITQPIIGRDMRVDELHTFDLPLVVEAWMSKNISLFCKSVGKGTDESIEDYDPYENLANLHKAYPDSCIYLALLSFASDLSTLLPHLPVKI